MPNLLPTTTSAKISKLKASISVLALAVVAIAGLWIIGTPSAAEAACTPNPSYGTDTMSVTAPQAGSYTTWVHMESLNGTSNQVMLSVGSGACNIMAGGTMAANTWKWVDLTNANAAAKVSLTQGVNSFVVSGNENSMAIDEVLFTEDTSCNPNTSLSECEPPQPVSIPYYLSAGGTANQTIGSGATAETWNADTLTPTSTYVTGGETNCQLPASQAIANADGLRAIYACERWDDGGGITYKVPVANGTYDVRLLFAEISPTTNQVGDRVFDVAINGKTDLTNFDVMADSGGQYTADVKDFPVTVTNGDVTIAITTVTGAAKISGFEILPASATKPTVSITAPTANSSIKGTAVPLTASASSSAGIKSVNFTINTFPVGSVLTASPYTTTWNSTLAANGPVTITATATDNNNETATATETVTVANSTCTGPPNAPSNLKDPDTALAANHVDLSWTAGSAASGCSLAGYNVYRGTTATNLVKINTAIVTGTTYDDATAAAATKYFYQITSVDTTGTSLESAHVPTTPLSVTTGSNCATSNTKPTTPSLPVETTNTYTSITMKWGTSTVNNGCTFSGYHLYRVGTKNAIYSGTSTSYTDTGSTVTAGYLNSGSQYQYYVVGYDSGGNVSTNPVTATLTTKADDQDPTMPTNLAATAVNSTTIHLAWGASTDLPNPGAVGLAGYKIYRCSGANCQKTISSSNFLIEVGPTTLTYSDTSASASTTYGYAVTAIDKNNNEVAVASVATATATTPAHGTSAVPGDIDGNSAVGTDDFNILLRYWGTGQAIPPYTNGDTSFNVVVTLPIFNTFVKDWGQYDGL